MYNRGIRGATSVTQNDEQEILQETVTLLKEIVIRNEIEPEDICSVWITMTADLDATFPARAIRQLEGWDLVPLMCSVEIPVQGSLPQCIRFMIQVNTEKSQREMKHVYLNDARKLRPDLSTTSN
ncbi:chorismate mutase [Paenibacillus macquariensis subsp. defensor]|uniref:chorismate mutase n=1 Tax=Paenibacillus macquariensis TaxID=948756 RepID=A0ABY1JJQ4_9BACL|nr:chorismate mutase [Paenibacillus macquariensis]MEC0089757.1 chorismate mutase [Paenibacillus macquariensis]OAB30766.1 chorismate mutase [Paenibacillus macquariensis subsp. macquariensis]OAB32611.1 chorismate mutase [Paenibacillus macquariensis subsp. defensor]SIQ30512.1 chorismate mutase [Paenibacillus macquariensis]